MTRTTKATKTPKAKADAVTPSNVLTTSAKPEAAPKPPAPVERYVLPHELALLPAVNNAVVVAAYAKATFGVAEADLNNLALELRDKTNAVNDGDMRSIEAMLYGQAVALQNVFTNLMRRAVSQEYLPQYEKFTMLGLKAQAQCRATLEALAEIKSPRPVAFVRQANIANGPQQVNNGASPETSHSHADSHAMPLSETSTRERAQVRGKSSIEPSKLLEASDVERLDTRAQGATGAAHQDVATVGTLDRADERSR